MEGRGKGGRAYPRLRDVSLGPASGYTAGVGPSHSVPSQNTGGAHGLRARAGVGDVARQLDGDAAGLDAVGGLVGERVGHLERLARLWRLGRGRTG